MDQIRGAHEWRLSSQRLAVQLQPSGLRAILTQPEGVLAGRRGLQDGKALILVDSAGEPNLAGARAVGYYRLSNRQEPTPADQVRLGNLLGDSAGVFLLLGRRRSGLQGKLFYYYGRHILHESSDIFIERGERRRTWTTAAASTVVTLAVLSIAAWYALKVQATTNTEPVFDLSADWSGAESRIRWNANSLEELPSAKLVINDGKITAEYLLSRRQIQEGSFSYTPRGDDVTFRLEGTDSHGHHLRESVVLARRLQPPPDPPIEPQRRRKTGRRLRAASASSSTGLRGA